VVHELTHCLVRHLPIPAWLNEGLAVNTEHRFVTPRPRYRANELQYLFARFWTPSTIQEFWSGKSFLRPDDGQPLSYELARLLVHLLDKDYDVLARFCATASHEDGGEGAAMSVMGASLEEIAAVVLGSGAWKPQPASSRMATSNSPTCGRANSSRPGRGDCRSFWLFPERLFGKRSASGRRQAPGSGGQATDPAGAVHRLVLWTGGLVHGGRVRHGQFVVSGLTARRCAASFSR
jgi:hypothetical protein